MDTTQALADAIESLDKQVDDADDLADLEEIFDAIIDALQASGLVRHAYDIEDAVDQLVTDGKIDESAGAAATTLQSILDKVTYKQFEKAAVKAAQRNLPVLFTALSILVTITD